MKNYLKDKKYVNIIEKYIKINISLLEQKLNDSHTRKISNKKLNFEYSIDFIYIIGKIIESETKKNNTKFDDIKKLELDLFNDFKNYYSSDNELLELCEKTGHINVINKLKPKISKKVSSEYIKRQSSGIKTEKKEKRNKNLKDNNKIEQKPEKYSFEYYPEIVNEPEINLPLKHIYTCEFTDKIEMDDEKLKVYQKYQTIIHKSKPEEITKEKFDSIWGRTNLIDNIGIKLPQDLDKKVKHPEIYPKKYGTYNIIHRIDGKIVAVGVWDILPTTLSSVYFYYDPDYQFLDIGVFTAIKEIEYIKSFHDLIDNKFKYYVLGMYCETVTKFRYKGFFHPTEIFDRHTNNFVYLKDIQNLLKDGKDHKLSNKPNNPNYKFLQKDEIDKFIQNMIIRFQNKDMPFNDFVSKYVTEKDINRIINETKRFLEIVPLDLIKKIHFIANFK